MRDDERQDPQDEYGYIAIPKHSEMRVNDDSLTGTKTRHLPIRHYCPVLEGLENGYVPVHGDRDQVQPGADLSEKRHNEFHETQVPVPAEELVEVAAVPSHRKYKHTHTRQQIGHGQIYDELHGRARMIGPRCPGVVPPVLHYCSDDERVDEEIGDQQKDIEENAVIQKCLRQ